jgi:hypothetical protein
MAKKRAARTKRPSRKPAGPSLAAATTVLKREAAKQRIQVNLTQDQLDAILAAWNDADPRAPAEVTFVVAARPAIGLKVAGYRYKGDTCCV